MCKLRLTHKDFTKQQVFSKTGYHDLVILDNANIKDLKKYTITIQVFFFFFFFLAAHMAKEVSGPEIKSKPQQRPHNILNCQVTRELLEQEFTTM